MSFFFNLINILITLHSLEHVLWIFSGFVSVLRRLLPTTIFVSISIFTVSCADLQLYKGDVTYYYEWKGNYGSCALNTSRRDSFQVAALSRYFMKLPANITNPNRHPYCSERFCIKVIGRRGSVVLKVSDTCYGCKPYDVDVADKVFPLLDNPRKGRVKMTWMWVDCLKNPPGKIKEWENMKICLIITAINCKLNSQWNSQ